MELVVPEAELLLLLARQDVDDERLMRAAALAVPEQATIDWANFIDLAVRHRVAPLVGWQSRLLLGSDRPAGVGTSALIAMRDSYLAGVGRSEAIKNELARILVACSGLRVAVRKGAHLAFHTYRHPGLRPMDDFDLLVTKDTAPAVVAVLNDLGYSQGRPGAGGEIQPFTRRQQVFWQLHGSDLPTFFRPAESPYIRAFGVDVNVELALPGKGLRAPVDDFLDRAAQSRVGEAPCLVLAPEDTVIDLSLHLYKNSTVLRFMALGKHRRLLKYVDLAEFLKQERARFSWQAMLARVRSLGVVGPVFFAFTHLESLFPASVPRDVLAELAGYVARPEEILQTYGQWDLPEPRRWQVPFLQRFFDHSVDAELPASRSLV